jgi:uncharacterized OsmC-like protein
LSLNHVNIDKLKKLIEAIKQDPTNAKITPKVSGEWIFKIDQPQFRSEIEVEGGKFKIEADMPSKLGGWGSRPGPLNYCLYGLVSCYAFTFAALAAIENITLTELSIKAEGRIDFSKVFGLADNPIVEKMNFKVTVNSSAAVEKLERLKKLADERCPAVYCLSNPIKVTTELVKT